MFLLAMFLVIKLIFRSSLRQSKKLKALSTKIEKSVSIDMPELNPADGKLVETRNIKNGYENQCYDQAELIYGKLESNNNQAIRELQIFRSCQPCQVPSNV